MAWCTGAARGHHQAETLFSFTWVMCLTCVHRKFRVGYLLYRDRIEIGRFNLDINGTAFKTIRSTQKACYLYRYCRINNANEGPRPANRAPRRQSLAASKTN